MRYRLRFISVKIIKIARQNKHGFFKANCAMNPLLTQIDDRSGLLNFLLKYSIKTVSRRHPVLRLHQFTTNNS